MCSNNPQTPCADQRREPRHRLSPLSRRQPKVHHHARHILSRLDSLPVCGRKVGTLSIPSRLSRRNRFDLQQAPAHHLSIRTGTSKFTIEIDVIVPTESPSNNTSSADLVSEIDSRLVMMITIKKEKGLLYCYRLRECWCGC